MDLRTREFLAESHDAVMVTLKRDGTPHVARVGIGLVDGKLWSSGTRDRVRTGHLRRDSRATLFVGGGDRQQWAGLETTVTILDGPEAPELNRRLYKAITGGDPDDVEEYLDAMVKEGRLIYEFEVLKAYGQF